MGEVCPPSPPPPARFSWRFMFLERRELLTGCFSWLHRLRPGHAQGSYPQPSRLPAERGSGLICRSFCHSTRLCGPRPPRPFLGREQRTVNEAVGIRYLVAVLGSLWCWSYGMGLALWGFSALRERSGNLVLALFIRKLTWYSLSSFPRHGVSVVGYFGSSDSAYLSAGRTKEVWGVIYPPWMDGWMDGWTSEIMASASEMRYPIPYLK